MESPAPTDVMSNNSLKRKAPDDGSPVINGETGRSTQDDSETPPPKRARIVTAQVHDEPRPDHIAHAGLQRGIALALRHVGFDTADPVAIESFTLGVEEYVQALVENLKMNALSARREQPNPVDFEATLRAFHVPVSSLKPHIRHPIDKRHLVPKTTVVEADSGAFLRPLPTLGEELSGRPAKEAKEYIPSQFPEFPSQHTYVSTTPDEGDEATRGGGGGGLKGRRDPKKVHEEVSKAAKQGEDALRGLMRASKVRQQKEVRAQVQRQASSRERYRLWELAMEKMMQGQDEEGAVDVDQSLADRVANASMIVNSAAEFMRREGVKAVRKGVSRSGTGAAAGAIAAP